MGLEQKINYQLNKYPTIKKVVKRVYQRTMYAITPNIKSEGKIERVSPDDPQHEYFFGYYDKSPWDATDRYMLCLKANDTWSDVSPREKADIVIIDTHLPESDEGRVRKIAETSAWNVQQACMTQWLGPDFSSRILYNDFRDGRYVSVILEMATGKERIIPMPVYTVAADGQTALSLDFSRLYNLRPGYGYYNVPESTAGEALPDSTAIWRVDLLSGAVTDLLSYRDFAAFQPRGEMLEKDSVHKVNHLMLSPNGRRFMVLYRWFNGHRKYTRLITCNVDGTDMYLLSDDDMVSHCFWKDDSSILAFENKFTDGPGYYLMHDKTTDYVRCWPQLTGDGHPSYSPDGAFVVTDSYPDRARVANIYLMDGNEHIRETNVIARVFAPFKYDNDTRCDLHPRWNHKGDKICFDSVFEGHRGLYTVDISDRRAAGETRYSDTEAREEDAANQPLISVIIPVYKVEKYLKRCVDSVLNQTYSNLEVILVDDGSPDNSGQLCDEIAASDRRVSVIHKKNGRLSSARNAGLSVAKGDFIAFVDSDDWIESDTYSYMIRLIMRYDAEIADIECRYATSSSYVMDAVEEKVESYREMDVLWSYLERGLRLQNNAPFTVWRKLYRRNTIGEKRFREGKNSEDLIFNYEVLKEAASIVYSNVPKYYYFQNSEGISIGSLKNADLALLEFSEEIYEKEKNNSYRGINDLTKAKLARSYFSILARIATAGYNQADFPDVRGLTKDLTSKLRKNYGLLMRSPIAFNRKALISIFCVDYRLVAGPYGALKKLRELRKK